MKFKVLSRKLAEEYSKNSNKDKSIIISIKSTNDTSTPDIQCTKTNNIKSILSLVFDDVETQYLENEKPISNEQAQEIVDFVNKWYKNIDLIIVHCDAGISRSAGICAALSKWLINDDTPYFNGYSYIPNMVCYRKVLNIAMGELNYD